MVIDIITHYTQNLIKTVKMEWRQEGIENIKEAHGNGSVGENE